MAALAKRRMMMSVPNRNSPVQKPTKSVKPIAVASASETVEMRTNAVKIKYEATGMNASAVNMPTNMAEMGYAFANSRERALPGVHTALSNLSCMVRK